MFVLFCYVGKHTISRTYFSRKLCSRTTKSSLFIRGKTLVHKKELKMEEGGYSNRFPQLESHRKNGDITALLG